MSFLLLSVVFSVSVSVLLKLVPRYALDIRQAICVNYMVGAILTWALFEPSPVPPSSSPPAAWIVLIALGVVLPAMFWVLAVSVRHSGVARTDAAMRLSLLLPLIAAFTAFGEVLTGQKAIGIALGLLAIGLIVVHGKTAGEGGLRGAGWLVLVFMGMGAIDILFKLMAKLSVASMHSTLLATYLLAALLSLAVIGVLYARGAARMRARHLIAGTVLGVLNYGNILFYLRAHRALPTDPALVFATMNIGVIVLASFVGVAVFRERITRSSMAGIGLAVVAIVVLTFAR